MDRNICDDCGHELIIGEWPYCPHERPYKTKGFLAYVDFCITDHPVTISNPGDKRQYMRGQWRQDQWIKMVERDHYPGVD